MSNCFFKSENYFGQPSRGRRVTAHMLLTAVITACLFWPAPSGSAEVVDRIVAVVNDDIIRLRQLEEVMAPIAEKIRADSISEEKARAQIYEARTRVLNEMIDEKLADQQIAEAGIQVPEQAVDAAVERVKAMNYYTDEDLRNALQMRGMTMDEYRAEIKKQILRRQLVNQKVKSNIVVTGEDMRRYYEAHREEYGAAEEYRLRNILMDYPEYDDAEERAQISSQMQKVLDRLREGDAFAELARKYSEAPNAQAGGELGKFAIEDLSEKLQPVIRALEPGQFSEIVETDRGFQIFYVEDIVETPAEPFEQVSDEIANRLYEEMVNEKYGDWIKSLRADAHIRIIR